MKAASVRVNEFAGAIDFTIELHRGINIIAGENGTGKTRLLHALKIGQSVRPYDSQSYNTQRVFALNPKRNSERRELNQIIQQMRQQNKSFQNFSTEAVNKHFTFSGFDNYSSFGELFLFYFDKLDRSGGDRIRSMNEVVKEFNSVIESIFVDYVISARWDESQGLPLPTIKKRGVEVPITGLSCGEEELFSLVLNLYSLREQFDVFLIDEPETHLNWHLEKQLFNFLKDFSDNYDKQLIIATHSRIIVDPDLNDYTQFLFWDNGKINVSSQLPRPQREKLLDDAFQSLRIGGFTDLTVFCEDGSHCSYFEALFESMGLTNYRISKCGTSSNVKSLYRVNSEDGGWANTLFVVDGDGQGKWKEAGRSFIQLPVYCIENYGLQISAVSKVLGRSEADIRKRLVELLQSHRESLFGKSKSLNFLVELLKEEHLTQERIDQLDGSAIFEGFLKWAGYNSHTEYWRAIFSQCATSSESDAYKTFVPNDLLTLIKDYSSRTHDRTSKATSCAVS